MSINRLLRQKERLINELNLLRSNKKKVCVQVGSMWYQDMAKTWMLLQRMEAKALTEQASDHSEERSCVTRKATQRPRIRRIRKLVIYQRCLMLY